MKASVQYEALRKGAFLVTEQVQYHWVCLRFGFSEASNMKYKVTWGSDQNTLVPLCVISEKGKS